MKKSDKLFMVALMMVILASAEVRVGGMIGALLQVVWSIVCIAIAYILIKKSEILEKQEREEK